MSASSSKQGPQQPPPRLHLHVDTSATAATATTNGSAASPASASASATASSSHSSRSSRRTNPIGVGSGSGPGACAACKHQRRRCNKDCPLAPYFPADQPGRFHNAQRLFGVSNILKTLRRIEPKYGPDAMTSLIYQSEARMADPVGGCVGIIKELRRQIRDAEMELQFVRQQVEICRQAAAATDPAAAMILPPAAGAASVVAGPQDDDMVAVDAIYAGQQPSIPSPAGGSGLLLHGQQQDYLKVEDHNDPSSHHHQQLYDYFCYNNGTAGDEATSDDGGMQQYGFAGDVVDSSVNARSPAALGEQLRRHCQIEPLPFVDAFNVKPQVLPPPTTIQHHGPAAAGDLVLHPEQTKLAAPVLVKYDDVDERMEEQQAATADGKPCHLELGFSSF